MIKASFVREEESKRKREQTKALKRTENHLHTLLRATLQGRKKPF